MHAAYNLARWLLGNDHDAEDAVQDANLKALRGFAAYRGDGAKAWYLAIVRNTCMNQLRSRRRLTTLDAEEDAEPDVGRPDLALFRAIDAERLRHAIECLPPAWREMIILREFEQMSYQELAEVAQVPIGTVMSRLSRARQRLQVLLCEETE